MPSKWIDHIKSYAKQHGLSYACALTDPNCSKSYKGGKTPATKTKAITAPVPTTPTPARARAIAAVKTLTSAPKIAPAHLLQHLLNRMILPRLKLNQHSTLRLNFKSLLKTFPPCMLIISKKKTDSEQDVLNKIKLLKSGVKFDKHLQSKYLWRLANPNLTSNSK